MAGIYLHIPFCKSKCHYCNFFSVVSNRYRLPFVDKLLQEIRLQKDYLSGEVIKTIYLGGGTPSLLDSQDINKILNAIQEHFKVDKEVEITLEANPDDISEEWVAMLKTTLVNRLSIGIQSFDDRQLSYLNRVHNARQAFSAIERLKRQGYDNLSIDLIYGIPGLSDKGWIRNLETFFSLDLPHLSAYALTVEPKTALETLIRKKKIEQPLEDAAISHFKTLQRMMDDKGYVHYEISNFALQGHYSKHNSLYWAGGHYLGFGPSAHSYNGRSRRWNKSSMGAWLALDEYYHESYEEEVLSLDQRYNEYIMTSLRTVWGCDQALVKQEFGEKYIEHLDRQLAKHLTDGMTRVEKGRIFLTARGKLFADGIAADLFV